MKQFILHDKRTGEVVFDGVEASRSLPCWVCEHKHKNPSWCLVDPVRRVCICQRVDSSRRIGDAGYWHGEMKSEWLRVAEPYVVKLKKEIEANNIDWELMWDEMKDARTVANSLELSEKISLPYEYVMGISFGWCHTSNAWAFPMRDEDGKLCGIKLRLRNGKKICVKGSRLGLVYAKSFDNNRRDLFVTEGESDCMVAAGFGFNAVARPSCSSCREHVRRLAIRKDVVVCADKDEAGKRGATDLTLAIRKAASSVTIITPPVKDLRKWFVDGITAQDVDWKVRSIRGF